MRPNLSHQNFRSSTWMTGRLPSSPPPSSMRHRNTPPLGVHSASGSRKSLDLRTADRDLDRHVLAELVAVPDLGGDDLVEDQKSAPPITG